MIELTGTAELIEELRTYLTNERIRNQQCPYCESKDVDWGFDSGGIPGKDVIEDAVCKDCGKLWLMHYQFEQWEPIDE